MSRQYITIEKERALEFYDNVKKQQQQQNCNYELVNIKE